MGRRGFLASLAGGLALAFAGAYSLWWSGFGDPRSVVVAILLRRLGFLRIDEEVFREFAGDYLRTRSEYEGRLSLLSIAALPLTRVTPYRLLPMGHPLRRLEDNVVTRFLMSTDFFQHGADEARPISYVGFYDPLRTPCRNFVARRRDQA